MTPHPLGSTTPAGTPAGLGPLVIKLGGAAIDRADATPDLWANLLALHEAETARGAGIAIIHGGGATVDRLLESLGLPVVRRDGIRITPDDQIDHVVATLAGLVNTQLVGALTAAGAKPVGLSLADAGIADCRPIAPEFGRVGEVIGGDPALIHTLWQSGFLPVVSSIGLSADGLALNINADDAAGALAKTLGARAVVFLTDVPGVLGPDRALLETLRFDEAGALIESGVIAGGMTAKVRAAMRAVEVAGVAAIVASWNDPNVMTALAEGRSPGTTIVADPSPSLTTSR